MALKVLKMIKGDPLKDDQFSSYEFEPGTISGDIEAAILTEMKAWEFRIIRKSVYDHDDYGKDESESVHSSTPLNEIAEKCFIYQDQLLGVKHGDGLVFLPSGKIIGEKYVTLWSESTSRSERYETESFDVKKVAKSVDPLSYLAKGKNAKDGVCGVDPLATEVVIPSGVTRILEDAFKNCTNLISLSIPKETSYIDKFAFDGLINLKTITVDPDNKWYKSVDGCLIEIATKKLILVTVDSVIPDDGSVTSIGYAVYSDSQISHVTIPEGVTEICGAAFYSADIESISLPKSLKLIDSNAFGYCKRIKAVYYAGTREDWDKISIKLPNNYFMENAPRYYGRSGKPTNEEINNV